MLTYVSKMNHKCLDNLPIWKFVTKPQQTNENMREDINHLTHIHLLNTIKSILTQTLKRLCKKRFFWQVDFDNLYFWNTLKEKTHHGILVWNRNNKLHTLYKMHVHKKRKETTHVKICERTVITTSSYIYKIGRAHVWTPVTV